MPDPKKDDLPEIKADTPGVKELIDAAVKEATSGLASNRDEILGEKKGLQAKLDDVTKLWDGLDPTVVRTFMTRLENDEEARLIADGKMDEVITMRTERLQADHATQMTALEEKLATAVGALSGAQVRVKSLTVDGQLRQAATELNLVASAIPDALARAMGVFSVQDDGSLLAEQDGKTIYGKDGKTPITPAEWLSDMKEKAPHWFPAPSGGGASGGTGREAGAFTISREDARDVPKYRAAKDAAEKAGATLQIVS